MKSFSARNLLLTLIISLLSLSTNPQPRDLKSQIPGGDLSNNIASIWQTTKTPSRSSDLPHAKNVILFIGDGMGIEHRTAAQWLHIGLNGSREMDSLPVNGLIATHSFNNSITGSAAAATAMATGVKTNNGVIGLDPDLNLIPSIVDQAAMGATHKPIILWT